MPTLIIDLLPNFELDLSSSRRVLEVWHEFFDAKPFLFLRFLAAPVILALVDLVSLFGFDILVHLRHDPILKFLVR